MNLRQIIRTVRAHWVVAVVTFLVCVLIGGAYAVLPAKKYEAKVVLLAQPPTVPPAGPGRRCHSDRDPPDRGGSRERDDRGRGTSPGPSRFQSVPVTITAAGDPSSNTVSINASSTDPAAAQAYANATAARVLKVANHDAGSLLVLSELGGAELPTTPTNPRATVALAALAFGLIAAVFAALAAGALRRFVAADEISDRLGIPVLGEVPAWRVPARIRPTCSNRARDERGLEAFQQLRSHLHVMFHETHPVIAFTSCDPREGKSTVAAHAAWALATSGQFVVAVDADLRQPRLHEIFGVELSPGVSDIAVATGPTELMAPTGNRYLEVIPAGVPTRHPADIAVADIPRLLRALRESDRTVVLDCPPVMGVAETTILVTKADAVILVVDARKFTFESLEQGLAHLRASGANVVGIVLNRVRWRNMGPVYGYEASSQTQAAHSLMLRHRRNAR